MAAQREGEVVHLVTNQMRGLSDELASVGDRDGAFPLPHGRGDEFHNGSPGYDSWDRPKLPWARNIINPHQHIDQIRLKTRDFR